MTAAIRTARLQHSLILVVSLLTIASPVVATQRDKAAPIAARGR